MPLTKKKISFLTKKGQKNQEKQLTIHFDTVFVEKDIKNEFELFLEKPFELLFLIELKELENTIQTKKIQQKVKDIFENFLLEGSSQKIEIPGKMKNSVLDFYESLMLERVESTHFLKMMDMNVLENFFKPLSEKITEDLKEHHWKEFLHSPNGELLVKKHRKNSFICIPTVSELFLYKDDYFQHPFIFDLDFDFAEMLHNDSKQWNLYSTQKNILEIFISSINYLPCVSYARNSECLKFECTIPGSFERVNLNYSTNEGRMKAGNLLPHIETIDYLDFDKLLFIFHENGWDEEIGRFERNLAINSSSIQLPSILNKRIQHCSISMKYEKENKSLDIVSKSYMKDGQSFSEIVNTEVLTQQGKIMKKSKVYPVFSFSFSKFQKLDEKNVKVSIITILDFGGWTKNETISKVILNEIASTIHQGLMKFDRFPEDAKIEDFKEMLCKEKDGKVVDGLGKLLYDLKIEK
jgi:hypothetical protein